MTTESVSLTWTDGIHVVHSPIVLYTGENAYIGSQLFINAYLGDLCEFKQSFTFNVLFFISGGFSRVVLGSVYLRSAYYKQILILMLSNLRYPYIITRKSQLLALPRDKALPRDESKSTAVKSSQWGLKHTKQIEMNHKHLSSHETLEEENPMMRHRYYLRNLKKTYVGMCGHAMNSADFLIMVEYKVVGVSSSQGIKADPDFLATLGESIKDAPF
ncbi:hypothetical protein Tco_0009368 [Tanacetum coccineum]